MVSKWDGLPPRWLGLRSDFNSWIWGRPWHLPELSGSHPECLQGICIPAKRKLTTILNVYTPPWSNIHQGQPSALIFLFPPTWVHTVTPLLTCQSGNCCILKPHHEAAPQGGSACSHSTELKTDVHFRAHLMAPRPAPGLPTKGKHNPFRCWPCVVHPQFYHQQ